MRISPAVKRSLPPALLLAALSVILAPGAAQAQPFGTWLNFSGNPTHGYVRVPHSAALNPTGAFTVEAWVSISNNPAAEDCRSIIGKHWQQAWWLGLCTVGGQPTLRSYLKGSGSLRQGGVIPPNVWTHVAVVFNGTRRFHYVNGVLSGDFPEAAPLTTSASELRIGSDVAWQFTPAGGIDEVRLWNVARTQAQLRANINLPITAPQAGLVALWNFESGVTDAVGPHDGSIQGAGVGALVIPAGLPCNNTATTLCLDGRFVVSATWSTGPGSSGPGNRVACATTDSGLFWFFSADNWELMVKAVNGCGLNNRHWIFSAATTNVFYRLQVMDVVGRAQKIYFNYTGPPAPAVTDTSAFATCP